MILFLNKIDLFEQKIRVKNLRDYAVFSDFSGRDGDMKAASDYLTGKFLAKNKSQDRMIYPHLTCATDTKNVRVVFDACKDIILRENLKNSGFMD